MTYSNELQQFLASKEEKVKEVSFENLADWNDKIESEFTSSNFKSESDTPEEIRKAAVGLHDHILSSLIKRNCLGLQAVDADEEFLSSIVLHDDESFENENANQVALLVSKLLSNNTKRNTSLEDTALQKLYAELIRSAKNIIRWNRILYMNSRKTRQTNERLVTSTECLCSSGMVSVHLKVLEYTIINGMDDIARQTCTVLFHSIYSQAPEPCCKKALKAFISPLDGIDTIAKLLVISPESGCSINVTLGLVKIVHNIVSCISGIMEDFDKSLKRYANEAIVMEDGQIDYNVNLFTILIVTLSWALRAEPSIASPVLDPVDRRADLIIEILRVIFALKSTTPKQVIDRIEKENHAIMTQLGIILVDLLKLSNRIQRCHDCKLASLLLLMNAPKEYGRFLVVNRCIQELLSILFLQVNNIVIENAGEVQSEQNGAAALPILIVLNELAANNEDIRQEVKDYIFPPSEEQRFLAKVEAYKQEVLDTPEKKRGAKKNMQPLDAPVGSIRWKIIKLMTYTESNVKRCASELLWTVCRKDPNEFVLRCGFGNSVHMLGIKGLYKIPKG